MQENEETPLESSKIKVAIPGHLPPVRITLVMTMLPLPSLRTSYPRKTRVMIKPKGIAPNK